MMKIDLNVDIGEGFAFDEALMDIATSVNICCGEHAGSLELTKQTIALAKEKGLRVGVHPGFPDRENMGRKNPPESQEWFDSLVKQVEIFINLEYPSYIKPHGAFYNLLNPPIETKLQEMAIQTLEKILELTPIPVMLLGTVSHNFSNVIREGFADRTYLPNGHLTPRSQPNSQLTKPDDVRKQVRELAPKVDSICLHGDGEHALEFARLVRDELQNLGYTVSAK
jgi:UPF0271 protein